jgi:hypothetical protein
MNKMKPIIFSTPMVIAILEGRKTQTRRIVKPKRNSRCRMSLFNAIAHISGKWFGVDFNNVPFINDLIEQPKCKPGDVLWVRETWYKNYPHEYGRYWYRADGEEIDMPTIYGGTVIYGKADGLKWRPSIYMPREAARIFLRVKNVRVERVQDITDADILAEGFECREDFIVLWNILNEKRGHGWNKNDWVYAYTFEKISKEEAERLEGMEC